MQLSTCQTKRNKRTRTLVVAEQHATVVGLVGKRCTVKGEINGQQVDVLWDTGAQVSLISEQLVRGNFPGITVKNISELLNSELNRLQPMVVRCHA